MAGWVPAQPELIAQGTPPLLDDGQTDNLEHGGRLNEAGLKENVLGHEELVHVTGSRYRWRAR